MISMSPVSFSLYIDVFTNESASAGGKAAASCCVVKF